ncbi:Re/Si-specific NAD(P)(+) transhydrogenase subunit alpha [Prochlorococcus sp. MIT 1341]|uniref:Re/Si-specific NAD(P)(+) transhydrogenase subunit alpha n=1 Tax=Prochlorococcus sp. MIT 1341 TaxID=3096221 RepID=UPI002A74B025|nr:Re/Si-specific NAD(P)(+) transhydrogenase subunit alpha [Prochlorococcus sp. MIT 1341]
MRILIPSETAAGETRVAATPETTKKFVALECSVLIEKGAGILSGFSDESYEAAGAEILSQEDQTSWASADILLCVQRPNKNSLRKVKNGCIIVGLLSPYGNKELFESLQANQLSALALELLPRISRAQSADALSSQANIAGYKSVLIGASNLDRYLPMLMTAAGTVQPAKVVVLGAGVAGLQAIATAKRLGAVVFVSDIRPAVKEQVESLGAKFIEPPELDQKPSESGGYAKEASEKFLEAQRQKLSDQLSEADLAICTAQVPGKKAPKLISNEMLERMRPGSVVVDLAVAQGGNCSGTIPSQIVERNGVKLIGASDLPCSVPNHASTLYSRNLLSLLGPMIKEGNIDLNTEDELIDASLICLNGEIRCPDSLIKEN